MKFIQVISTALCAVIVSAAPLDIKHGREASVSIRDAMFSSQSNEAFDKRYRDDEVKEEGYDDYYEYDRNEDNYNSNSEGYYDNLEENNRVNYDENQEFNKNAEDYSNEELNVDYDNESYRESNRFDYDSNYEQSNDLRDNSNHEENNRLNYDSNREYNVNVEDNSNHEINTDYHDDSVREFNSYHEDNDYYNEENKEITQNVVEGSSDRNEGLLSNLLGVDLLGGLLSKSVTNNYVNQKARIE